MNNVQFIKVHEKREGYSDLTRILNINYIIEIQYWPADPTHKAIITMAGRKDPIRLCESFEDIEKMLNY